MKSSNNIRNRAKLDFLTEFLKRITKYIVSKSKTLMIDKEDNADSLKQNLFIGLALFSILGCGPLLIYGANIFIEQGMKSIGYIEIASYIILVIISFYKQIKIEIRHLVIVFLLYSFSVILLITAGNLGAGLVCIVAIMFLAGLVLSSKKLIVFMIINIITFIVITHLLLNGNLSGLEIEVYRGIWFINLLTTQLSGIGLMFLVHIIHKVLKLRNYDLLQTNELLKITKKKEELYADIYRSSPIAIGIGYPNGDLGECNKQCTLLTGYSNEEISTMKWNNVVTPKEWIEKEINYLSTLNPVNDIVAYEKEYLTKTGKTIPVELTVKAKFKDDSSIDYYISFVQDISARKAADKHKQKILYDMRERIKELRCIKKISDTVREDVEIDKMIEKIVNLLPEGFQFPGKTCAKITYNDICFYSVDFEETSLKIECSLTVKGVKIGIIEVFYKEENFKKDNKVFLKEEQDLIDNIAILISETISKKRMEIRLFKLNFELENLVYQRTQELKKTSSRLQLATKAGKIGVWEWYAETKELVWDEEMCELYDFESQPENLSFLFWFKTLHPEDRKRTYQKLKKSLKEKDEFSAEFRIVWKDNSVHYIKSLATIYRNSKGIAMRIVGVNWDVTEQKELNLMIKKEGERLQNLLDDSPIAVVITTGGVVKYQNNLFANIFGFSNGDEVFDLYVDIKDRKNAVKELNNNNVLLNYRIQAYKKDGNIIELIMNYYKMEYKGKTSLLVWIVDITPIIEMEEQLTATRHAAESVIDYSPLPLLILDRETYEVLKTNKSFLEYNEIDNEFNVNPHQIVINPEINLRIISEIFQKEGVVQNQELEIRRIGSNKTSWVMFSMYPVIYNGVSSLAITFMDISEKNEYQTQLAKAKDEAIKAAKASESATRTKSEFLANMSHEIRTPINAIMGLNDLMYNTNLSEKQKDYANKISSSSKMLLQIINDILDFSKIEAGRLCLEETRFSIESVLTQIKDSMALRAFEKGIEFIIDIDETVPDFIISDSLRLKQVLLNLTSNAIKFTDKGTVIIKLDVLEDSNDLITLRFIVKDTGIGIKEEQVDKLFKPFSQADASTTREYGGTGLGLVISKNLVEMMGGEIGVKSISGEGSEFCFTIKAYKYNNNAVEQKYQHNLPECFLNARILLVIENNYTRNVFAKYIQQLGNLPKLLSCGEEAVEELQNNYYDLVIMDCKMHGLGGVESWHIIRDILDKDEIPKVLMVTAYGTPEVIRAAESENIDEVLIKPVTQSKLYDAIVGLSCDKIHKDEELETVSMSNTEIHSESEGIRILLVEDNEINQQVAKEILELKGYKIDVAGNGQIALEKLKYNNNYDVILMDLQMPVMDGYEATQRIRRNKLYKDIPIIALSADAMHGIKEAVLAVGMNDYISKPIDQKLLNEKLIKIARSKKSNEESPAIISESPNYGLAKILKSFDVEDGLSRINNNIELYLKLLAKFKDQYYNFTNTVIELIDNGYYDDSKREVHTIKGVSATIGAINLNTTVKELEEVMKKDITNIEIIHSLIDKIKLMLTEIINEINSVLEINKQNLS